MDLSKVRKISYQFELDFMDQDISVLERRGIISSTYFVDSKSGVDIFKVFNNDYVNFHIGNFTKMTTKYFMTSQPNCQMVWYSSVDFGILV